MYRRIAATTAALLALGATLETAAHSPRADAARVLRTFSFYSPSGNLSCEMDDRRAGVPAEVICGSDKPPHMVWMSASSRVRICNLERCLGNVGEGTPTLPYGRSVTVGRFRCTSLTVGVRCVVTRLHRGFLINRAGVTRVRG